MKIAKINLGPFDRFVDYLKDGQNAEYPITTNKKVFYYPNFNADIVKVENADCSLNIPIFDVGSFIERKQRNISDPKLRTELMAGIEIQILMMIGKLIEVSNTHLQFNNIHIAIKSLQIFDGEDNTCYGWAEIALAIIV